MPPAEILTTPASRFDAITDYPWPVSYVEVEPGVRMAYVTAGPADAAETVLLLHGEPMWGYLYRKMIGPLAAAGFRVVVPDLVGFGRSSKFADPAAYSYSGHVAWVGAFMAALDLRGVTLFGQDWGGLIGSRLLAENLPRFSRAVMSNTNLPASGPAVPGLTAQAPLSGEDLAARFGMDWRATVGADDAIDPAAVQALVAAGAPLYFLHWRVYSQAVARLLPSKVVPGWCLHRPSEAALAAYDAPFPDERHAAAARRFPLLVPITADDPERARGDAAWAALGGWDRPFLTLWGDRCPFTFHQRGALYRERIPGARLRGLPHKVYPASHFIQEDQGEAVAADIAAFIRAWD